MAEKMETEKMETDKESEKRKTGRYEIDMCSGPLLGKILIFYIPLMLSGVLQLLFNAADIAVAGSLRGIRRWRR